MKPSTVRLLRSVLLTLTLTSAVLPLSGENVRGIFKGVLGTQGDVVVFNPEDLVAVESGDPGEFGAGLELRLQIPAGLRRYQNSFALMIFKNVSPGPSPDTSAYRGSRTFMRLIPARDSVFVRIPFSRNSQISGDALTDVLPLPVEPGEFPILVTVLPVMKGIPDAAFREQLTLSLVPLVKNEGTLTVNIVNLSGDEDEVVGLTIDGEVASLGEAVALSAGLHRIRVESSAAPPVERNIAIEPGEQTVLNLELDYRAPEVLITIPEGARVLLDGQAVGGNGEIVGMEIPAGDHMVTYILGDLEVSRSFSIVPGGKVTIDLIVDISIVDFGDGTAGYPGAGGSGDDSEELATEP